MRCLGTFVLPVALIWLAVSAHADSLTYVISADPVTGAGMFGTLDVSTGAFRQFGSIEPDGYFGLAQGPNGKLLSLTYTGNLDSINPSTGIGTVVGPTGLGSCPFAGASGCGPNSALSLVSFQGTVYATNFANNLYIVNPNTGVATLLSQNTGIPASPFVLGSQNPDGTLNFADEALWQAGGSLYATFDAFRFDPATGSAASIVVPPELFQINPFSGLATAIGPTNLGIGGAADVDGTTYAFNDLTNQIVTVDLATGKTNLVGTFDPAAGVIQGATATPEPVSVELTAAGALMLLLLKMKWNPLDRSFRSLSWPFRF